MEKAYKYFPESWYPICLSHEISKGEVKEVKRFDLNLTLFRNKKGKVGLVKNFCPHMGTRLCNGHVNDETLVCPLHHRKFNLEGKCVEIPGTNKSVDNSDVMSLPIHEDMGLIFAYLGKKPKFEFPEIPRAKEKKIYSGAIVYTLDTPCESLIFNGFDTHHLGCIHNRQLVDKPIVTQHSNHRITTEYGMSVIPGKIYDWFVKILNATTFNNYLDCYGGNILVITCRETKDNVLMVTVPIDHKKSKIFLISIADGKKVNPLKKMMIKIRLAITTKMAESFLKPDINIIAHTRTDIKNFFPDQDHGAIEFWRYFMELERDVEFQDALKS